MSKVHVFTSSFYKHFSKLYLDYKINKLNTHLVYTNENTKWLIISISVNLDVSYGRTKIIAGMAQYLHFASYIDLVQNAARAGSGRDVRT